MVKNKKRKCGMYYYVYIPFCFKNNLEHKLDKSDREWYKNGQIRVNGLYENGIKTGKWEYWYQGGTKRLEDIYENSKKDNKLFGTLIN